MSRKTFARVAAIFVALVSLIGLPPAPAAAQAPAIRPDSVSLTEARALADAVGISTLFERVAKPDPYLTDFFGIQVLQPLTREEVTALLVPRHARHADSDAHTLTLDLIDGPRVSFRFQTRLFVNGNAVDAAYARVHIRDAKTYPADAELLRTRLVNAGLADRFLVRNRLYEAEQAVFARMQNAAAITPATIVLDTAGFGGLPHAALLVGETHGGTAAYDEVTRLAAAPAVQWVGIEMLSADLQPALTRYTTARPESPEFRAARDTLLRYYAANWNTRGHEVTSNPADNPYFRLIELARVQGKCVYALDTEPNYILFRFGEFPLGAAVRDYVWASHIPAGGRGVVYGGSSHFLQSRQPNMLTFLRERQPALPVFRAAVR